MNIRPSRGYCRNDETLIEENLQNVILSKGEAVPFSCYLGRKCEYRLRPTVQYSARDSSHPQSLAVADFNSDGQMDIAFVDPDANSVGILLGYGTGEFSPPIIYSTGVDSLPTCVVAGDFNSDGRLDIAIALAGANSVGVLLGYGNGKFSSQTTYFIGPNCQPLSIVADDLNDDGCADICVANYHMGSVGVLFGHGNGRFTPSRIYSVGADTYPRSIVVGDFNRDHRLYIAVVNQRTRNVAILLGKGDGDFPYVTYSTKPSRCSIRVAIGDFENNGRLDIAVANYDTDSVNILLGCGNGSFENQTSLSTGKASSPISIVVANFNYDNQLDIAVVNSDTDNIGIFLDMVMVNFLLNRLIPLVRIPFHPRWLSVISTEMVHSASLLLITTKTM